MSVRRGLALGLVMGWLVYAASLIILLVLGAAVLTASHFILKARGVRP